MDALLAFALGMVVGALVVGVLATGAGEKIIAQRLQLRLETATKELRERVVEFDNVMLNFRGHALQIIGIQPTAAGNKDVVRFLTGADVKVGFANGRKSGIDPFPAAIAGVDIRIRRNEPVKAKVEFVL